MPHKKVRTMLGKKFKRAAIKVAVCLPREKLIFRLQWRKSLVTKSDLKFLEI